MIDLEGIQSLRWLATRLKGIEPLADSLEKLNSLDNAIAESERRLDLFRQSEEAYKSKIEELNQTIKNLTFKIEGETLSAKNKADKIVAEAVKKKQDLLDTFSVEFATAKRLATEEIEKLYDEKELEFKKLQSLKDETTLQEVKLKEVQDKLKALKEQI